KQALRRGLENPIDKEQLIAETQAQAHAQLTREGLSTEQTERVWGRFTDTYFLRHTPEEIAWHTKMLVDRDVRDSSPLVSVEQRAVRSGTGISTFTPKYKPRFPGPNARPVLPLLPLVHSSTHPPHDR